ncbi:MAG: hypothetical protein QG608_434 [Actinomycetota bacterium]|nr:hypothetical protein [Actinomycetota bacterium]
MVNRDFRVEAGAAGAVIFPRIIRRLPAVGTDPLLPGFPADSTVSLPVRTVTP